MVVNIAQIFPVGTDNRILSRDNRREAAFGRFFRATRPELEGISSTGTIQTAVDLKGKVEQIKG
ncbi:MAG: hypothetical protein V1909_01715, partial [Candidatus Micrarchaeota archaeon]